jgi:predicted metal-dependent hydrolase
MAPLPVIDYVILHELAHLKIHNHSRQFWARLAELAPDYREHKKWLEKNGYLLHLD